MVIQNSFLGFNGMSPKWAQMTIPHFTKLGQQGQLAHPFIEFYPIYQYDQNIQHYSASSTLSKTLLSYKLFLQKPDDYTQYSCHKLKFYFFCFSFLLINGRSLVRLVPHLPKIASGRTNVAEYLKNDLSNFFQILTEICYL